MDESLIDPKSKLSKWYWKRLGMSSIASYASLVLFARKPGGGLRFCVDYQKLNAIIEKDRYPIALIAETIARLSKAKLITKIDIIHAFNRIRMHSKEDEGLTTFRTKYGTSKYLVILFGLTNGPFTFQNFMNDTLMEFLDDFVVAHLNDILIYSENEKDHIKHVRKVLKRLEEAGIQADIDKCEFHKTGTKVLGMIVGQDDVRMNPAKVQAIVEWETPRHLKEIRAFLKFDNFYRRFISKSLVNLTKKEKPFNWDSECEETFNELKKRVIEAHTKFSGSLLFFVQRCTIFKIISVVPSNMGGR